MILATPDTVTFEPVTFDVTIEPVVMEPTFENNPEL
jgi:hypothetical protein